MNQPANDIKFITCSDIYREIASDGIYMQVKIDSLANCFKEIQPVMLGVVEAVKDHVSQHHAETIYKNLEPHIAETVKIEVTKFLEKRILEIMSKIDLDTLAKLAAISASKQLGASVV